MTLINSHVLMSDASHFNVNSKINPYYTSSPIHREKVAAEHAEIKRMLESADIQVTQVKSPVGCQDGIYTANWALVRGDTAVLSSLPNARHNEEKYAEKVLTDLGKKIIHLSEGLKFSGQGDALPCGDLLFCGKGYRSDEQSQKIAAETLGFKRIQLETIPLVDESGNKITNKASSWPDSYFYDIDLALAVIKPQTTTDKGLIAYCKEAFTPESQSKLESLDIEKIFVSFDEATHGFATNLVSTGETVIMSAHAPQLADNLRQHGMTVLTPKISELSKGGGYIRCVTLTLG